MANGKILPENPIKTSKQSVSCFSQKTKALKISFFLNINTKSDFRSAPNQHIV